MKKSGPNCERCMGIQLWPENHDAMDIYLTVREFGKVTFEALHRAKGDFQVEGVDLWRKLSLIHRKFEEVRAQRMQQQKDKK